VSEQSEGKTQIVELPARWFLAGCVVAAILVSVLGALRPLPVWLLGVEMLLTVLALFVFGSIRYRLDKNALTYGAALVVVATFWWVWWPHAEMREVVAREGWMPLLRVVAFHLFTLEGLDRLVHADTMLFLLGLTLFVSVVSQTRLLESISFRLLRTNRGAVVPTVLAITALVSFASGILDGVSMIGLTLRILVIILFLADAKLADVRYAVMVSTVVTTVCGMWLAYGEPPNLIMKANLRPHLDDAFFLAYCAPLAVASYFVVACSLRRRFRGSRVAWRQLDLLDQYAADVRFLQAERHGEVWTPIEFLETRAALVGERLPSLVERLHHGTPLGVALVQENVPERVRRELLGDYVHEELAEALDEHYRLAVAGDSAAARQAEAPVRAILRRIKRRRVFAQRVGLFAFLPFIVLLVAHAIDHHVRLFYASFAGFLVALAGIWSLPRMRRLALLEAWHEYREYLFLLPLFLSITLMQVASFFDRLETALRTGIAHWGEAHMAWLQFATATVLSALLDNNVVADFAARALHDLDPHLIHFFSMAQIAGYALGGCWTHIGCAQSVVAYAFLLKDVDSTFTPMQWIRAMTGILLSLFVMLTVAIYLRALMLP
jgi:Na+/H+ antiporter NhaD/arsenite permease-like protein